MNSTASFFGDRPELFSLTSDPLTQVLSLLRPHAASIHVLDVNEPWAAHEAGFRRPMFCAALQGRGLLDVKGHGPGMIDTCDFILVREAPPFWLSGFETGLRALVGSYRFDCGDPDPLLSLLPRFLRLRESSRISLLLEMADREASARHDGYIFNLMRIAELMLVEAMRHATLNWPPPGLLRGLGDALLLRTLHELHSRTDHPWTVEQMARVAGMSRSAFHERFSVQVGKGPMEYLHWWRMLIARDMLARGGLSISQVARRVGYRSASAFSTAFSRHTGTSPALYVSRLRS